MDNERYLVPVEEIDCLLGPGKVIMGIRHQSNVHNDLDSRAISHLICGVKDTPDGRRPMSDDGSAGSPQARVSDLNRASLKFAIRNPKSHHGPRSPVPRQQKSEIRNPKSEIYPLSTLNLP